MNVNLIPLKIKQRLNKLASNDYDNIECWQYVEAYNKAQREWVRRNLHGGNIYKQGDEQTTARIDDLQILITPHKFTIAKTVPDHIETSELPSNYMRYKRLDVTVKADCGTKSISTNLIEEGNVQSYYNDWTLTPSLEWEETFHTFSSNKVNVYKNEDFNISSVTLYYYRQPIEISLANCPSIDGTELGDINPEFKDDLVEIIIDEAVSILAADIESPNASVISQNRYTKNN